MSQQKSDTSVRSRPPVTGTAIQPKRKRAPFFVELYRTAVGKKYVMAVTGLMGLGFVFTHMLGNLKMYLGPVHFDEYAEWLRTLLVPFLPRTVALWLLRFGLVGAIILHIHSAVTLTIMNRKARPVAYQSKRDYIAADYASRTMRWSGIIVFLFIAWHLFDLSWTGTGQHYVRGATYANVVNSLDPREAERSRCPKLRQFCRRRARREKDAPPTIPPCSSSPRFCSFPFSPPSSPRPEPRPPVRIRRTLPRPASTRASARATTSSPLQTAPG